MAHIRIYLNDVLIDQVELKEDVLTIGRNSGCDIVIDNAGISSMHAVIEHVGNNYIIRDKDSTNGVFVNGERVKQHTLAYWDEIQLYNYVLKFMAIVGIQKSNDVDITDNAPDDLAGTMEINIANVQDLVDLRKRRKAAYVVVQNMSTGNTRYLIEDAHFTIGKAKTSDVRTSGWFAPAMATEIQRQIDGYYLVPRSRAQASINGRRVAKPVRLSDGDSVRIRNLDMTFNHRLISS